MLRVGLALYLLLTTVAGPWVCCCSGASTSASEPSKKQAKPTLHCCCCAEESSAQPENNTPPPATLSRTCHCQEDQAQVVLSITDKGTARPVLQGFSLPSLVYATPSPYATLLNTYGDACPFSSGRDLLTTLHILRC